LEQQCLKASLQAFARQSFAVLEILVDFAVGGRGEGKREIIKVPLETKELNLCKKSKEIWLTEMERLTEKNSVRVLFRER